MSQLPPTGASWGGRSSVQRGTAAEDDVARRRLKLGQPLEPDQFRHHGVYQLLAYCTASDVARGLLIYPADEVPIRDEVHIRNTSVLAQQTTIDLGGSGEQLRRACYGLAGEVSNWIEP